MTIQDNFKGGSLSKHLSPLAVWALAFGSAVGWGSFVMPGTTFLPAAGPWGTALGMLAGAAIMFIIGWCYWFLMKRYPDAGGSYTFAAKVIGSDHGFLCAWMLLLTYAAIIWANSTALALIIRFLFGDLFCFGFSYQIAGYTVYMGEVLLATGILALAGLICIIGKRFAAVIQILCALLLFGGITACFAAVVIHRGGITGITPAFSSDGDPAVQVMTIAVLAPWAFIGFESVSHSSEEFRFKPKKSLPILIAALLAGALAYIMLTLCASMSVPDGFKNWAEYITSLASLKGIQGLPTFYAAQEAMGVTGLVILGIAAFCGIITGLIGNLTALSRLIYRMSTDGILPKGLSRISRRGVPSRAILCVVIVSLFIPFLGRTAIGWIVDVTTIGATIVYACVSVCALVLGKREKKTTAFIFGALGILASMIFILFYSLPDISPQSRLASESYLILLVWSVIGITLFRVLMQRDKTRKIGKSIVVWIVLFCMILLLSVSWINRTTAERAAEITGDIQAVHIVNAESAGLEPNNGSLLNTNTYLANRLDNFSFTSRMNVLVFACLILGSLALIFSIFSLIRKREKLVEAERMLAEENSRAKSAFLSNMSHDIRTPMNAVTGYTALALKEENIPDNVRGYLEKIDASGKQLLSLINDILEMSRIESGKTELETSPEDLCADIEEACHIFDLQMSSKPLNYTVDCGGVRNRYVVCDKARLNRVLMNLVSNAYKFTPEGGSVSVKVTEVQSGTDSCVYEFTVSDTGIGMTPEFTEHIFDAYERENNSTVNNIQGTGLGMSITKSLVELMGGTIAVRSQKDKGTVFTIRLSFPKASEDEVVKPENTENKKTCDYIGERILVADDNPINVEIASMILTQEGFEVTTAENGQAAVDLIKEADDDCFSAVLMDVHMPVMGGYEATRTIRQLGGKKAGLPIVAITANSFESDRKEAFDAGMDAHIGKPFRPEELVATLARLIEEYKTN